MLKQFETPSQEAGVRVHEILTISDMAIEAARECCHYTERRHKTRPFLKYLGRVVMAEQAFLMLRMSDGSLGLFDSISQLHGMVDVPLIPEGEGVAGEALQAGEVRIADFSNPRRVLEHQGSSGASSLPKRPSEECEKAGKVFAEAKKASNTSGAKTYTSTRLHDIERQMLGSEYLSYAVAPILAGSERHLGVLGVARKQDRPIFTDSDIVALSTFARLSPVILDMALSNDLWWQFLCLAASWKAGRGVTSSLTEMVMHPAYQEIIGMGRDALPFLLRELEKAPDHWYWALKVITGEDPVPAESRGNLTEMTQAWLAWGREHGYVAATVA